eukprot:GHRR01013278.1.p1 GENE.GHRR01013278.1~~GHRR01013278.1.p1  ORF type:complete len:356 (+),score=131.93 GHRR01013278.1:658-1725(+)
MQFKRAGTWQGPVSPTASSKSPAVTPCLAVYSEQGMPVGLLQNSSLISRYAVLRAAALGNPSAHQLYGPSLKLAPSVQPSRQHSSQDSSEDSNGFDEGVSAVIGSDELYKAVSELELRLAWTMGVEVRRVVYYYMLPSTWLCFTLFHRNSSGMQRLLSWPIYLACRLLLPKVLKITDRTAARGRQKLLEEFDHFDQLLWQRQQQYLAKQQQQQADMATATQQSASLRVTQPTSSSGSTSTGTTSNTNSSASNDKTLPYYLCGDHITAADISLATLAGYIIGVPSGQLGTLWAPPVTDLPPDLRSFVQGLAERPTGRFVQDVWRVYGSQLMVAGGQAPEPAVQVHSMHNTCQPGCE